MRSHFLKASVLLSLCSLCSCQSLQHASPPAVVKAANDKNSNLAARNNVLALLDDLLGDEKNLSKILIVKRNSDELGKLVENISKTAGNGAKMLEIFAKDEPGLNLRVTDLPPGEVATRRAISKTKEKLLLHSKDAEFEFQLLLTQVEALNYGAHLAMIAAENETRPEGSRAFLQLSAQLRNLHEQVVAMVRKNG